MDNNAETQTQKLVKPIQTVCVGTTDCIINGGMSCLDVPYRFVDYCFERLCVTAIAMLVLGARGDHIWTRGWSCRGCTLLILIPDLPITK